MDPLTLTLVRDTIALLGTAGFLVAAITYTGKKFVDKFFDAGVETLKIQLEAKNNAELEKVKADFARSLEQEKAAAERAKAVFTQQLATSAEIDARIRHEIVRWANPILNSLRGLSRRLENILKEQGHLALDPTKPQPDTDWSIDYPYFINSSIYFFAQYFCWVQLMQEELSFELFKSHSDKDEFFMIVYEVSGKLGDYPPHYQGNGADVQVFNLQQRAIGDRLVLARGDKPSCMGYHAFLSIAAEPVFEPLRKLLDNVKPADKRWARLAATHQSLVKLQSKCEELLKLKSPSVTGTTGR
jgi:hypothetical protein